MTYQTKRIIAISCGIIILVAAVLGFTTWRKHLKAEREAAPTIQTTPTPRKTTTTATPTPSAPPATPAQVRAHASKISKQFTAVSSTVMPEAGLSPYEVIAQRGQDGASKLMDLDQTLSDRLRADLQWSDKKTNDVSGQEIRNLDKDYKAWETELWSLLNSYADSDVNQIVDQVKSMKDRDPSECPTVQAEMLRQPDSGLGGRQGFAVKSKWLTAVGDRWQECNETQAGVHD